MLNRVEDAVELCKAAGRPSVKAMGDLFHMSIEEDDLGGSIRAVGDSLGHVHLADSSRLQPGTAHTDFAGAFAALQGIDFVGYMAVGCGIWGNPEEALPEAVRHLRSLMG